MNAARGVVFDLDGTVIDSLPDLAAALNRSLARHGMAPVPREEVAPMVGDGAKMLLKRGYEARGMTPDDEDEAIFLADYEAHVTDLTEPYPGIAEALGTLAARGYSLGMCTNKPEASARKVLAALDLDRFFPVLIGGDATTFRKPDPRHLGAVLEAMAVGKDAAVMVGDHHNDIATADRLGVASIFVRWGYGRAEATVSIDETAALVPAVERLLGAG
ncbi:phosphoglycolate phosphatase [Acidiphilium sp. PM]|uniref:phosphoglycolate phosphatase n=1 Tax=Acidiphilium sp. PM TaxID=1043206 RepID=UPI0002144CB4|nr:phosphoglycolate phosphatase [Acidiphilium sp. PM]EGO95518.1 Phosphoglycolate phosphatase [Acidiphilium sp. PM]